MNLGEKTHSIAELYAAASKLMEKELVKVNKKKLTKKEKDKSMILGREIARFVLRDMELKE